MPLRQYNLNQKTPTQKLTELVDWFLQDKEISLEFSHNATHKGKIAPEYDCYFYWGGRRITDRALVMAMNADFLARDYKYAFSQVMSALTAKCWAHYLTNFVPPEWVLAASRPDMPKRGPGRPRKYPEPIAVPEPDLSGGEPDPDLSGGDPPRQGAWEPRAP